MLKKTKTKHHARRAASAAKSALKHLASEVTGPFHSAANADIPNVNFAALRLCALALTSK